ncbi:hypothetical protein SAMN04487948_11839 [Halogranum amylolyticum]|uniref:Uncharacterized protein n=1 Tax=Halogranum amylolyticum TaxID=660520 RepID=A0A1H8VPA1_9EURY|nr:hypothetical protein SAMN04487948_11839 [Halogranum amylolyticum]
MQPASTLIRLAQQVDVGDGYQVVPFRGEYYEVTPNQTDLCRTMIYPTPDLELPAPLLSVRPLDGPSMYPFCSMVSNAL